ncbi:MAG: Crp/Fnr family transcriptional regulator [Campylobacterota bacterium]|nr:Crp/Fnr family transcriptional regulator [Campylobacterota bacterium]
MYHTVTAQDLKTVPLFSTLSTQELEELSTIVKVKHFNKGDILHYEKDKQSKIYYLKEGLIKVYKTDRFDNEIFMYNLFNETLISEITDFENIGCFANAEFVVDSKILIVDFDGFKLIYENNPILMMELLKEFAKKSKMMQCIINREIVFDGTAKVAFMLINDLQTFNQLKKTEIAYMLNIQPETLSRILKKLTRNKMITSTRGKIAVNNNEALRAIFE